MGLNPSCNNVDGQGLPVLGDPPFAAESAEIAKAELRHAFPDALFEEHSEVRKVYKKGTKAHSMACAGIHMPGMAGPDDIEEITVHDVKASARDWKFRRAWYYWACSTEGNGVPAATAEEFNKTWGSQVRVNGCAGGQDVRGVNVRSYHVDTFDGLIALAKLIEAL